MPGIDYRRLRHEIMMDKVLDLIGFQATWRHGLQLRGPCPLPGCPSTSPRSLSVHLTRKLYHCFACGSHGNVLDLWAVVSGLPLHQAALDLCHRINLKPPQL